MGFRGSICCGGDIVEDVVGIFHDGRGQFVLKVGEMVDRRNGNCMLVINDVHQPISIVNVAGPPDRPQLYDFVIRGAVA